MSLENVVDDVDAMVREHGSRAALVEWDARGRETRMDYSEFGRRMSALAAGLAGQGVGKGDRVLLLLPMGAPLYLSILAVMRLGAVCVFVDPYMGAKRFDACCAAVQPKAFIGVPKGFLFLALCPNLRKARIRIATGGLPGFLALSFDKLVARHLGAKTELTLVESTAPALISFTTGSSGSPKGSNRTHGFIRAQRMALYNPERAAFTTDFPGFPVLPLENLGWGRTTYVPAFKSGKVREAGRGAVRRQLQAWRPELMSGSPAYLEALADEAAAAAIPYDSVRHLFTGGAPITIRAMDKLTRAWPNAAITIVYGSTEVEPVSHIAAQEALGECRALSARGYGFCVGRPVPSLQVIILPLGNQDSQARDLAARALPQGSVGEIVARGPHVNTGYWNNAAGEAANKIKTSEGIWHRMGDAGYFDAQGRLWVVGRVHAAMANPRAAGAAAGEGRQAQASQSPQPSAWPFLFPYQAECIADEFPGVRKSAYLAINDSHWLVVELLPGPRDAGLETALARALEAFPLDGIRVSPALPMDPRHNSKVEYDRLRTWLAKQPGVAAKSRARSAERQA